MMGNHLCNTKQEAPLLPASILFIAGTWIAFQGVQCQQLDLFAFPWSLDPNKKKNTKPKPQP